MIRIYKKKKKKININYESNENKIDNKKFKNY